MESNWLMTRCSPSRPASRFASPMGGGWKARRILIATGMHNKLRHPGVRERWGRDLLHCPYCHG